MIVIIIENQKKFSLKYLLTSMITKKQLPNSKKAFIIGEKK